MKELSGFRVQRVEGSLLREANLFEGFLEYHAKAVVQHTVIGHGSFLFGGAFGIEAGTESIIIDSSIIGQVFNFDYQFKVGKKGIIT